MGANLLALRRYAVLVGVPILALGSAAPVIPQLWLAHPQQYFADEHWTFVADLIIFIVMLSVGSWLVLARPGPMTWGFYWYLAGWRVQLITPFSWNDEVQATFPGGIPLWGTIEQCTGGVLNALSLAGIVTFSLRFPYDRVDAWRRSVERATWCAYMPIALICFTVYIVTGAYGEETERGAALVGFFAWLWCGAVGYLFSLAMLLLTFVRAGGDARQRLLWIAVLPVAIVLREARLIGFFGYGGSAPWIYDNMNIASVIVPLAVAYAVLRYRVFDVQFALSRAMAVGAVATLIGAIFLGVDWVLSRSVGSSSIQLAIDVAVALGIGFGLNVLQQRLSGSIDALLFRQRYLAQRGMEEIERKLYSVDARPSLYALLVRDVSEVLNATSAAVFERLDDGGYLRNAAIGWPAGAAWHLLRDHPVALAASRGSLSRIDRVEWYDLGDMPPESRPAVGVSISVGGQAQALLLLGPHRNGTDYDGAAVAALRRLSDRVSVIYGSLPSLPVTNAEPIASSGTR